MSKTGSNLLFLAVGAAVGAAVGFIAATDSSKKQEWLNGINNLVDKVKGNASLAMCKGKDKIEELTSNIDE